MLTVPVFTQAQTAGSQSRETINVYLDCRGCNDSYVRSEVNFVNFVRDQSDAEVHLLVTLQQTGSGGWKHTLNFIGLNSLNTQSQEMTFISPKSDTNDMMRNRLVKYVKLGLVYFLADRDVLSELNVNFSGIMNTGEEIEETDPWNSWIFRIGASTNFSGEQSEEELWVGGSLDARRITENWKIRLEYDQSYEKQTFYSKDDEGNKETDIYVTENRSFFGLLAHSLGDHWTIGSYSRIRTSTQDNIDLSIGATPSIEYSLFPYHEHTRREVTFRYGVLGSHYDYTEATIYEEEEEFLWRQELSVRTDFTQPWGGIYGWLDAGNYMHDFSLNRVNMGLRLNMRVMRGLSVFLSGRYSVINDQLSLAAGEVSEEERLLNLKQQATSYNYRGSFGLEFNFGSVYNNVVNSRF
ncbi:hypothetical protein [Gracilimonas mengyeensis]|uniref:Outer membrane protein beta-barrel family protein n=1 Tax=Gracilimonas mengyeensis TaxID=1302730 RepID=A0A521BJF5_9BACT|nr:hypothetical protein [Gracilimonas mengyeensis]SMO47225.1 hypothetical protein SAMN06265219_102324 [Gracilimonas mengyeensis]